VYTGIRPGEKLSETLHEESEVLVPTSHSAIVGLESSAPYSRSELDAHLVDLERLCRANRTAELRKALFKTDFVAVKEGDFDRI
jgi:FlaA1/EpsC-like NDP-sugar epimerase